MSFLQWQGLDVRVDNMFTEDLSWEQAGAVLGALHISF